MYGVNSKEDITTVKKVGFNCFQTYKKDFATLSTLATLAKKEGLKAVFYTDEIISEDQIKQANTWPVLAWYLYDEPKEIYPYKILIIKYK